MRDPHFVLFSSNTRVSLVRTCHSLRKYTDNNPIQCHSALERAYYLFIFFFEWIPRHKQFWILASGKMRRPWASFFFSAAWVVWHIQSVSRIKISDNSIYLHYNRLFFFYDFFVWTFPYYANCTLIVLKVFIKDFRIKILSLV